MEGKNGFPFQVNVIHFGFVLGAVLAMMLNSRFQDVVIRLMSVSAAVLLLLEMIFQIDHFKVSDWVVNCTVRILKRSAHLERGGRSKCVIFVLIFFYLQIAQTTNTTVSLNGTGWLGLYKVGNNATMIKLLSGYICEYRRVTRVG